MVVRILECDAWIKNVSKHEDFEGCRRVPVARFGDINYRQEQLGIR
jgi:hypothetical protein